MDGAEKYHPRFVCRCPLAAIYRSNFNNKLQAVLGIALYTLQAAHSHPYNDLFHTPTNGETNL